LELLDLIEDYRHGQLYSAGMSRWGDRRSRSHRWWGGFCQGARRQRAALNRYAVPDWVPVPSAAWVHLMNIEKMIR